jgi:hypothetical protein
MARTPSQALTELIAGDTFAVRLPDGRFGACRVLRTSFRDFPHSALVAAPAWVGAEPPPLTEPRLRLVQRLTTEGWAGQPNALWVHEARVPETWTYLGVLPASGTEEKLYPGITGDWESFPAGILRQWQHDEQQGLPPADSEAELQRRGRAAFRRYAVERRRRALADLTEKRWFAP